MLALALPVARKVWYLIQCTLKSGPTFLSIDDLQHVPIKNLATESLGKTEDAMFETDVQRSDYSDRLLQRRVSNFLSSRHFPDFRYLTIDVDNGCVTLSGILYSHYQKQVALDSCRRVAGVLNLSDQIQIKKRSAK